MIARARAALPPGMPSPPSYQKVNPADSADPLPDAQLADAAAVAGRRLRGDGARAAALDGQRRRAGQRLRRAEVRRAHRCRSDAARLAADRHRPGRRRPLPAPTSNRPTGTLYGPQRNFVVQAQRPADGRRGLPARSSSPTATAARSASSEVAQRLRRRREPTKRELVQRHADHLPRDPAAARHQHGRGRRRDQGAAARAAGAAAGVAAARRSAAIARCRSASRSTTSSSRCC